MSQTMQDVINKVGTDAGAVATDQATIVTDTAKLASDQTQLATDQTTEATDTATEQADLAITGPVASVSADGLSVTIYAAPGAVIPAGTPIPLASSVPAPTPTS